ncbi:hypothetical protein QBC37DRAFT_162205 [Rhypophila decipiens]|uniref:Uncharacterized protein n=1 Tax=Rhypophila decipiens TaxID=261697 RepID=A0AAN6Y9R2_9PEZI|nr:hypothetical protein QBC37DRAFT_162205 [Rhypophila decipiens]
MAPADRLAVLPFLQTWSGSQLQLRVLLIPRDSFIEPHVRIYPQSADFFPSATLKFDVLIQPGLDAVPLRNNGDNVRVKEVTFTPMDTARQIFAQLLAQEDPMATPAARPSNGSMNNLGVFKHLPASYRTAVGYSPGTGAKDGLFSTGSQYSCSLKEMARPITYEPVTRPTRKSWGQMISGLVRNSKFAELAGLVRAVTVDISAAQMNLVRNGAFVFLVPQASGGSPALACELYSARIPILAESPRELFTPVLFPVVEALPGSEYDDIFPEAEDYSDGWAKVVHCRQPQRAAVVKEEDDDENPGQAEEAAGTRPVKEIGIQIGWDDQQVTIWMDRQLDSSTDSLQTGLGIRGYCVDARFAGEGDDKWRSLVHAKGSYGVGTFRRDDFDQDSAVEVHPAASIDKDQPPKFWMPMYFSTWTGPSLVGLDNDRMIVAGRKPDADAGMPKLEGIAPPDLPLLYGRDYEFRVRLLDQTGWGPGLKSAPTNPAVNPVFNHPFRRWIKPMTPVLVGSTPEIYGDQDDRDPGMLRFLRPGLQMPAVQCTNYYPDATERLKAMIEEDDGQEPSLPDPDVDRLEMTVLVETLTQDTLVVDGNFRTLYKTTRTFSSDISAALDLEFDWVDCFDVDHPDLDDPNNTDPWKSLILTGPLKLPKSRTVRLCVRSLCKEDSALAYFGADDVRRSPDVKLTLRKNAATEKDLFTATSANDRFNACFLQPPIEGVNPATTGTAAAVPTPVSRLATEIGLRNDGNILRSAPGRRVVFGCSAGLGHAIGPDGSSLNLAGNVAQLWIAVIKLTINRDWTWDGLVHNSIVVRRTIGDDTSTTIECVRVSPTKNVNHDALSGPEIIRSGTDLVLIDAFDPLQIPSASGFPDEINARYTVNWDVIRHSANTVTPQDDPLVFSVRLPVTTAPTQQPMIVSAGIALSPYMPSPRYSSTAPRTRMLWIELAEPPLDPQDRYFARVLAHGPDPLLLYPSTSFNKTPIRPEAPLPLDPEPLRRITLSSSDDRAGLDAMQPLVPSTLPPNSPPNTAILHWGLPLPPGTSEDSPDLFGFYTYEIGVGHYTSTNPSSSDPEKARWCTAQSRFGPPLRLTGVQHPAPNLACAAYRPAPVSPDLDIPDIAVEATAPLAKISYKIVPTSIWFMLYAQAPLLTNNPNPNPDGGTGSTRQNILLLRQHANAYKEISLSAGGYAIAQFKRKDVQQALRRVGFRTTGVGQAPLSVLAVEMVQRPADAAATDPLGYGLGTVRILRASSLVEVRARC